MAKRLSEEQKKSITNSFKEGKTIDQLAKEFSCTESTIVRNLKKFLGEKKFKELSLKKKSEEKILKLKQNKTDNGKNQKILSEEKKDFINEEEDYFSSSEFMEITPLDDEIDNLPQKDLSSLPISDIIFPNTVYMVVDKNIELKTKYLKEYPDWQFLSEDELNRKTIEIHNDLKSAKMVCNKEQKVIKVPNSNVFKIVAPILLSRGISRLVNADKLIAL